MNTSQAQPASQAHPASEVLEEHAEGDLKGIYKDLKETLRVPIVPPAFMLLATQPDYLRVAWRQLHTNLQTVYSESRADEIRAYAVTAMSELGESRTPVTDEAIGQALSAFHYMNAKLLLAVAALRSTFIGQVPRVTIIPAAEKRQIAPGIAASMPALHLADSETRREPLHSLFGDIRAASPAAMVGGEFRALAQWPEYLQGAWETLKARMATPEYGRATRQLRWMADEAVLGFPFRMDATPHTLRHAGLAEQQIDQVRAMLHRLHRGVSESVANVAVLTTGIEGRSGALQNRYPVTLL